MLPNKVKEPIKKVMFTIQTFIISLLVSTSLCTMRAQGTSVDPYMRKTGSKRLNQYHIEFEPITSSTYGNITTTTGLFITVDKTFTGFNESDMDGYAQEVTRKNKTTKKTKKSYTTPTCCSFIGNGAKWSSTLATFKFDTANPDGIASSQLESWQNSAFSEWNNALSTRDIVNPVVVEDLPSFLDPSVPDGINTIVFDVISIDGVIAVTFTHYISTSSGNTIFEADIVYNTLVPLGDGSVSSSVYDFFSVATHEAGHSVGQGHVPTTSSCLDSTMYPTVSLGQTNKRDITGTDAQCLQALYEGAVSSGSSVFGLPGYLMVLSVLLIGI